MTQLKTISLKQTETIDPSTKQAGEKLIQILDTMFKSFGSIVYNASSLFATILYKNEKFGTSHLQALTHQSSWMDVPLSTFKLELYLNLWMGYIKIQVVRVSIIMLILRHMAKRICVIRLQTKAF